MSTVYAKKKCQKKSVFILLKCCKKIALILKQKVHAYTNVGAEMKNLVNGP